MKNMIRDLSLLASATLGATLLVAPPRAETTAQLIKHSWPPSPSAMVNLDSCNDPSSIGTEGCNLSMSPLDTHVIYTVPAGRHLVVTNFEARSNVSGTDSIVQLLASGTSGTRVLRGHDFSGAGDEGAGAAFASTTGMVFRPGEDVVIRRTASGSTVAFVNYTLSGYLAR